VFQSADRSVRIHPACQHRGKWVQIPPSRQKWDESARIWGESALTAFCGGGIDSRNRRIPPQKKRITDNSPSSFLRYFLRLFAAKKLHPQIAPPPKVAKKRKTFLGSEAKREARRGPKIAK
jgi:hypothetical protein